MHQTIGTYLCRSLYLDHKYRTKASTDQAVLPETFSQKMQDNLWFRSGSYIFSYLLKLTISKAIKYSTVSSSINTVHSKYCNTVLHTSRKCHCSVGVTSGDVEVDTAIRGVGDSDHILHCTVAHIPTDQYR